MVTPQTKKSLFWKIGNENQSEFNKLGTLYCGTPPKLLDHTKTVEKFRKVFGGRKKSFRKFSTFQHFSALFSCFSKTHFLAISGHFWSDFNESRLDGKPSPSWSYNIQKWKLKKICDFPWVLGVFGSKNLYFGHFCPVLSQISTNYGLLETPLCTCSYACENNAQKWKFWLILAFLGFFSHM